MIKFYSTRSSKWNTVRKEHLKTNNSCSGCGKIDKLEVHHMEPVHVNPERELDLSNLITLCKSCHFNIGHLMDWNSWNKEVAEDCRVYLIKVKNRPYKIRIQSNENSHLFANCLYWMLNIIRRNKRS